VTFLLPGLKALRHEKVQPAAPKKKKAAKKGGKHAEPAETAGQSEPVPASEDAGQSEQVPASEDAGQREPVPASEDAEQSELILVEPSRQRSVRGPQ
jgi:hypothetical protein